MFFWSFYQSDIELFIISWLLFHCSLIVCWLGSCRLWNPSISSNMFIFPGFLCSCVFPAFMGKAAAQETSWREKTWLSLPLITASTLAWRRRALQRCTADNSVPTAWRCRVSHRWEAWRTSTQTHCTYTQFTQLIWPTKPCRDLHSAVFGSLGVVFPSCRWPDSTGTALLWQAVSSFTAVSVPSSQRTLCYVSLHKHRNQLCFASHGAVYGRPSVGCGRAQIGDICARLPRSSEGSSPDRRRLITDWAFAQLTVRERR